MSLVGAEGTLDGLGTVVTAELPRHIDRLLGKHFEDLCAVRSVVGVGKPRVSCLLISMGVPKCSFACHQKCSSRSHAYLRGSRQEEQHYCNGQRRSTRLLIG